MTTKRRQSSSYSEDLSRYEFIDYTSASNFEKFITHIEETLYSWGIKDGSYGVFSKEQLETVKAAIANPSVAEFTRKETLTMGEDVFQLTYSYHPCMADKERHLLASEHFYQLGAANYHPIHRWSGFDRIMILKPVQDSIKKKIFNSGGQSTVDMSQAKQLMSACAIAFQNADCKVPVFVPVGQSRFEVYTGYMVRFNEESSPIRDTEVRFNMSLITPPSSQLWYLDGLKALFLQKLCFYRENHGVFGEPSDSDLYISAVYTYNLKNWYDENWKEWDDIEPKRKNSFSDDFESWGDDDDNDDDQAESFQSKQSSVHLNTHQLSFGAFNDPLRSLTLSALFPLAEESEFHEKYDRNMDALTAKQWQISREFAPVSQQRAFLSTLLDQVIDSWMKDLTNNKTGDSTNDSLGLMRNIFSAGNQNVFASQTASAAASISSMGTNSAGDQVTLIKSDEVENVLTALFHSMSTEDDDKKTKPSRQQFNTTKKLSLKLKAGSSVPHKSFLWNLLLYSLEAISQMSLSTGSNKKQHTSANFLGFLRVIWTEVLRQIRWHWENLVPIPDMNPYLYDHASKSDDKTLGIDLRYNILHQKLSMVNCCIYRRLQNAPQNGNLEEHTIKPVNRAGNLFDNLSDEKTPRVSKFQTLLERFIEGGVNDPARDSISFDQSDIDDQESEDSDVFLDAIDDTSSTPKSTTGQGGEEEVVVSNPMQESFVSLPNIPISAEELEADEAKAVKDPDAIEGVLQKHESLKLLQTGEPMNIPITQDPGFMTEDMITEQAGVFERLGTSETATQQRAKLQSAQLYSDMQAFKAANAHACLEDFVRWHSPRDWIVNEEGEGRLSTRMSEPCNIWQELWKYSKRIPCSRQKPLFNISAEAEKALYFLETTSVHDFFSIMLPTLGLIAYDTLSTHPIGQYSQQVSKRLVHLGNELVDFAWDDLRHNKKALDNIISDIRQLESMVCHAISLIRKLPKQYSLIDELLLNDQATVKEGEERSTVFHLFRNDHGVISEPSYREYVLYSQCKDMATNNRILPQRQYSIVKDNEIRIMDMQTTDALHF